jgi:anti-anti-sigma factor
VIGASAFDITSEFQPGGARLHLTGELDIATAPALEAAVDAALKRGAQRLLLDLSDLSFVDSSGLRLFIILSERARGEGWTLYLTRPVGAPMSVFRLTGAEENLPFVEDPS